MQESILLAGSDVDPVQEVDQALREQGHVPLTVRRLADVLEHARRRTAAAVVICGRLDDARANDLLTRLRTGAATATFPVLVVGEAGDEVERLVALELGADDYLARPLNRRELGLRVAALLRRVRAPAPSELARERYGLIELERNEHRAWVSGQTCDLSPAEFRVLVALASPAGTVHARERLRDVLEVGERSRGDRFIDARVARLRERLGPAGAQVETVRGVGYRLDTRGNVVD